MGSSKTGSWRGELGDFSRAFSGAFLFGVTLLYTMEMWWIGTYVEPWRLLVLLGFALAANFALSHFAGFKKEGTLGEIADQTVDSVAVGAVSSLVVLLVLNRIKLSDPLDAILGQMMVQAVPLSIGASLARFIFSGGGRGAGRAHEQESEPVSDSLS